MLLGEMLIDSVLVLTLNWQRAEETIALLKSLALQTHLPEEIVVVDNGSRDDSVERIHTIFPKVTILENDVNLGFAGGMNIGLDYAYRQHYQYLLLINNDTVCAADMIETLKNCSLLDDGIFAPVIYYYDYPDQVWSVGGYLNHSLMEIEYPTIDLASKKIDKRDFLTGCALFGRTDLFKKIGFFDDTYFLYYEDRDFCMRANTLDIPLYLSYQAKLWHKVSQSSDGSDSPNERYWMGRSSIVFFRTYSKFGNTLFICFWRFGSALKTTLRLLKKKKHSSIKAYWLGLLDGFKATLK